MTFEERKTIAVIFNGLLKEVGADSTGSYSGRVTVVPVKGDRTYFTVRKLSWSKIDILNETKGYRINSEKMEKSGDSINIVFQTDERPGVRLYATELNTKRCEVIGEAYHNRYRLELDGNKRVYVTDDERGSKKFEYNLE